MGETETSEYCISFLTNNGKKAICVTNIHKNNKNEWVEGQKRWYEKTSDGNWIEVYELNGEFEEDKVPDIVEELLRYVG